MRSQVGFLASALCRSSGGVQMTFVGCGLLEQANNAGDAFAYGEY
jgi:hypothetical protein